MNFKAIEEMIHVMDESSLGYLEVDWDEVSIIMKKKGESGVTRINGNIKKQELKKNPDENKNFNKEEADKGKEKRDIKDIIEEKEEIKKDDIKEDKNIKDIKSPIVGTFYSKASPDKPNYVNIGDKVKKGDVLCIIEAMKIMNEIQSDVNGEIVDIMVKNEEMVEYGQNLFKIKLDK